MSYDGRMGYMKRQSFQFICPTCRRIKSLGTEKTSFLMRTRATSDLSFSSSHLKLRRFHAAGLVLAFDRDHWHSTDSVLKLCVFTAGLALEKYETFCKISICFAWE